MSAQFWNAMADDANLLMSQQRIINRYLAHHFGVGLRVSETELRQNLEMVDTDIRKEKSVVAEGAKRVLKRNRPNFLEEQDHESERKEARETKRAAVENAETTNPVATRVPPRRGKEEIEVMKRLGLWKGK